jgi:hypothetical protein
VGWLGLGARVAGEGERSDGGAQGRARAELLGARWQMIGGPCLSVSRGGSTDTLSGAGGLLGWAGFPGWAGWLARGPLLFF